MPRVLLLLLAVMTVAGCGGKEMAERQEDPPAGAKAAASASASKTAVAAPSAAAVTIKGFTYSPARVTVRRGGVVTWTDEDASNHTVTFEDDEPKDVGNLREGRSAKVTFEKRGSFAYICEFHPGMAGTVEVR